MTSIVEHADALAALGWTDQLSAHIPPELNTSAPMRVAVRHRAGLDLIGPTGALRVPIPLPHVLAPDPIDPTPCSGDWVLVENDVVTATLPRHTRLVRKVVGRSTRPQVVAANLDRVFLVTSMNADFSARRIERYLIAVRATAIEPIVVLTKADLAMAQMARFVREVEAAAPGVPVIVTSAHMDMGVDLLAEHLGPGITIGFVGSSGTGKSTLVNALVGTTKMHVSGVRESDSTGQHTTTHRELISLGGGRGLLLDTPGMREFQPYGGDGIADVFADVEALTDACQYRDCRHGTEPGCAIQAAMSTGELDPARHANWLKLNAESSTLTKKTAARRTKAERKQHSQMVRAALRKKKGPKRR